jgi:hypothetical protein
MDEEQILLTKAKILQGTGYSEEIYIEVLEGKVRLRSLTDSELSRVRALQMKGLRIKGNDVSSMEMNLETVHTNKYEANCLACSLGLSMKGGDEWTVEDVKKVPTPGFIEEVAKKVMQISGVKEEDIAFFRPDPNRTRAS